MTQEKSIISYQVELGDSLSEGDELKHKKPLLADAAGLSQEYIAPILEQAYKIAHLNFPSSFEENQSLPKMAAIPFTI